MVLFAFHLLWFEKTEGKERIRFRLSKLLRLFYKLRWFSWMVLIYKSTSFPFADWFFVSNTASLSKVYLCTIYF